MVAAWDFGRAADALVTLRFDEQELAARLAARRDQVGRLVPLKQRILDKVNSASPPLKKGDLKIRGFNGEIVAADETGLVANLMTGKTEPLTWQSLGAPAVDELIQLVIDDGNADDWLAAGLLALVGGNMTSAEQCFQKARSLGANVDSYQAILGTTALARVTELLEEKEFDQADALLTRVETNYADSPWLAANREAIDAARTAIRAGMPESDAEKLFQEAVELFGKEDLFGLETLVKKLKSQYAGTAPVTDTRRKPSFAEMEQAVAGLGEGLTVRTDGPGDFIRIQPAIS